MSEVSPREMSFHVPMVTIYDRASDRHEPPMVFPTLDVARRRFGDMVNTEGSVYCDHPVDFVLRYAGLWDLKMGCVVSEHAAETIELGVQICTALEVKYVAKE